MRKQAVSLLGWSLAGALLGALGAAGYYTYVIIAQGGTLAGAPVVPLLVEVMKLHHYAGYGAAAGLVIALLEHILLALRRLGRGRRAGRPGEMPDTDEKIKAMRAARAEEYLESRERPPAPERGTLEPPVENLITAKNGEITYRVLAYRALSHEEMMRVVRKGLDEGTIREPSPGGVTTVMTTLGHG